mmetsp:Transcript_12620/g.14474  ORF Transcript_12620/g.14474 Transcript_12620/m.14474 type:complete len:155 (+) Transcript_12620:189-653(+)
MAAKPLVGKCLCGACCLEVDVSEPVVFSSYCHCTICQRRYSSPLAHLIAFKPDMVKIVAGEDKLVGYNTSDYMVRYSCSVCSSNVYNQSLLEDYPFRDIPHTILETEDAERRKAFLNDPRFKPTGHIFYPSRVLDVKDGLTKFKMFPDGETVEE